MDKSSASPKAALFFLLAATAVLTGLPAAEPVSLEKTVPLPASGIATIKVPVGPLVLEEVVVRNMPDASDLEKAKSDPDDNCHPKLAVGFSNPGPAEMEIKLVVRLEGDDGTVYMTCDREDEVNAGAANDHTNLCILAKMKTKDWPKVTRVRISVKVSPKS